MERIVVGIRLRIRPPKRRAPSERLHARLYYRKNRAKIRMQRRRYLRAHRSQIKHRKMFMRYKPSWFKKPIHKKPTSPHHFKVKVPKLKMHVSLPKEFKLKKIKKIPHTPKIRH